MSDNEHIKKFMEEREQLNEYVMKYSDIKMKRFFSLDTQTYRSETLSAKMKELLGLVASVVLRCDDCIKYHLMRCFEEKLSDKELEEALSIAMIVGGTITVPHVRKAFKLWDELKQE